MNNDNLDEIMEEAKREEKIIEKTAKKSYFIVASEIEIEWKKKLLSRIEYLKGILADHLIVECPKCGSKQHSNITLTKKCVSCKGRFVIYPEKGISRVFYCPSGLLPYLHELYALERDERPANIL